MTNSTSRRGKYILSGTERHAVLALPCTLLYCSTGAVPEGVQCLLAVSSGVKQVVSTFMSQKKKERVKELFGVKSLLVHRKQNIKKDKTNMFVV